MRSSLTQQNELKNGQQGDGRTSEQDKYQSSEKLNLTLSPIISSSQRNNENSSSSIKQYQRQQASQESSKANTSNMRSSLEDYTNQYINEFTIKSSPMKKQQNSRSASPITNGQAPSSSSKRNMYTKQCSSNFVSREISTPTEKSLQLIVTKPPQTELDEIKEGNSFIMRSQTTQSNYNNSNNNSFIATPSREHRPKSSMNGSSIMESSSSSQNKLKKSLSPQKHHKSKLAASTQMPLSSTEIIGSLSCSTILNKSTSLLNRSNITPNKNNATNNSILSSSTTRNNKTGLNQSQFKIGMIDDIIKKSAISRLGLTLKPVCSAHKHQQLKYICVDPKCIHHERVLCQQCIEAFGHEFHQIKTIEEYILLLESSFDTFNRKFYHFKTIKEELEHPAFLGSINQTINEMKLHINNKLDGIKDNIFKQYYKTLQEMDQQQNEEDMNSSSFKRNSSISSNQYSELKFSGGYLSSKRNKSKERTSSQSGFYNQKKKASAEMIEEEIKRMDEINLFMENIIQKNFFDLSKKEINMSLALAGNQHYMKLEEIHGVLSKKYKVLQNTFTDAIYKYTSKMQLMLNDAFENCPEFKIPLPDEYTPEYIKNELMSQYKTLENEVNLKRKQMKLVKQHLTDQQEAEKLSKTVTRIEPTFPYNTYNSNCYHLLESGILCNTTPIFECCQQAYQCVQCHYKFCRHQPKITTPSKRYCMKCLSVFKVQFPTDVSINCDDCLKEEEEQQSSVQH